MECGSRNAVTETENYPHSTVMWNPDPNLTFLVRTDVSDIGIGAVFSQRDPLQNYAVVEKECLVIKIGVQAFSVYLFGKPFIIQTDH